MLQPHPVGLSLVLGRKDEQTIISGESNLVEAIAHILGIKNFSKYVSTS